MIIYILSAVFLLILFYLSSSTDTLNPSIPKVVLKILLKYLGLAAPLKCDNEGTFSFNNIRLTGEFTISERDISIFRKAVDSTVAIDTFLLTSKTTPLVVAILADARCPIKPLGAVNTKNIIRQAPFDRNKPLKYIATFGTIPGKRRKRGAEFAVCIDVSQDGVQVLKSELWFLQFLPKTFKPVAVIEPVADEKPVGEKVTSLSLTAKGPILWAASCKDYNPIHISRFAARLFGFRSTIAHGNHVAALLIAELGVSPAMAELEFLRPMFLPGTYEVFRTKDTYTVGKHMRLTIGH